MKKTTNYYALFGENIVHSPSPEIHQHFAAQFNIDLVYEKIQVYTQDFSSAWKAFVEAGGAGANITMPLKRQAYTMCTTHSDIAQKAESVNTIKINGLSDWYGDNTDGMGFIRDMVNYYGHTLTNQRILLLGAGGAAAGILPVLLAQNPIAVIVANRTLAHAKVLSESYRRVAACDFQGIPDNPFDYVINTAADLPLHELTVNLRKEAVVYDIRYNSKATQFIEWGMQQGAQYGYDGFGMLLEQAAESFKLWFGVAPSTAKLRKR